MKNCAVFTNRVRRMSVGFHSSKFVGDVFCLSAYVFTNEREEEIVHLGQRFTIKNFSIFIPSMRRTLFFQKKIKQLNVPFMAYIVATQTKASLLFKACLFSVIELKTA